MSDGSMGVKSSAAASAVVVASTIIQRGAVDATAEKAIIDAARTATGKVDPAAADAFERVAAQFASVARTLRNAAAQEARPLVNASAFPLARGALSDAILEAVSMGVSAQAPMSMSTSMTVVGARQNTDGGHDVLVAMHPFMRGPQADDEHWLVTVKAGVKAQSIDDWGTAASESATAIRVNRQ